MPTLTGLEEELEKIRSIFKQNYYTQIIDTNYIKENLEKIELDKEYGYVVYLKGINGAINSSQMTDECQDYIKQVHTTYQTPLWKVLNGEE